MGKLITYRMIFYIHVVSKGENQEHWCINHLRLCKSLQKFGTNFAELDQSPLQSDTRCPIFVLHPPISVALWRCLMPSLALLSLPPLASQSIPFHQPMSRSIHLVHLFMSINNKSWNDIKCFLNSISTNYKSFDSDQKHKIVKLIYMSNYV